MPRTVPLHRNRRSRWARTRTLLALATVGVALVVASLVGASYGRAGTETVPCTKHINVIFIIYQYYEAPTGGNGCWTYSLIKQRPDVFMVCSGGTGSHSGSGNFVFDDTNPNNDLATENYLLNTACVTAPPHTKPVWAEFMAPRNSPSTNWCNSHGYTAPCWRRNYTPVGNVPLYAELYSDDSTVRDRLGAWTSPTIHYGAAPSNSKPLINIRPDIAANHGGSTGQMRTDIALICNNYVPDTQYMGLYAGGGGSPPDPHKTITATDRAAVVTALNNCTG